MASFTNQLPKPDAGLEKSQLEQIYKDNNANLVTEDPQAQLMQCFEELLRFQEKLQECIQTENDHFQLLNQCCVFCAGEHLPESCSMCRKKRIKYLQQKNHCTRCLHPLIPYHSCNVICAFCNGPHHVAICRNPANWFDRFAKETKEMLLHLKISTKKVDQQKISFFSKPDLPQTTLLIGESTTVIHPQSISASLILPNPDFNCNQVCYVPNITVSVQYKSCLAYINCFTCSASFVSPRLLSKLKLKPTKMSPIKLNQICSRSATVDSYAILELCSLYKPSYRYRRVFYVLDVSYLKVARVSSQVKQKVAQLGIRLSSEMRSQNKDTTIDLIIGQDHYELTGLSVNSKCTVKLGDNLLADYTHFGFILTGTEENPRFKSGPSKNEPRFLSYDHH